MSSIKIAEIDADWLAENVNGKVLLKAVGSLMGKKRSKKSSDGASVGSREVSEAMQQHHERTSKIASLLRDFKKEVEAGDREFDMDDYPKGAHLRVVSYLKSEETIDAVIEGEDMDAIEAAVNFLVENPDWKPEGKAKKAPAKPKKAAKVELSDSEDDAPKPKAKAKSAAKPKEEKPKKPAAKPVELSDSEDDAPKPKAKAAPKPKEEKPKKAAKADDSDSEDEKPKPKAKPAAKPVELSDSEEEEMPKPKAKKVSAKSAKGSAAAGGAVVVAPRIDDFVKMSWEGKDYSWDQDGDGGLYEGTTRVGSFDGTKPTFA